MDSWQWRTDDECLLQDNTRSSADTVKQSLEAQVQGLWFNMLCILGDRTEMAEYTDTQ